MASAQTVSGFTNQNNGGVNVYYTPEDTMKSFMMKNVNNFTCSSDTRGVFPEGTKDSSLGTRNNDIKNNKNSKTTARPEPKRFLRKGQGSAAWCSTAKSLGKNVSNKASPVSTIKRQKTSCLDSDERRKISAYNQMASTEQLILQTNNNRPTVSVLNTKMERRNFEEMRTIADGKEPSFEHDDHLNESHELAEFELLEKVTASDCLPNCDESDVDMDASKFNHAGHRKQWDQSSSGLQKSIERLCISSEDNSDIEAPEVSMNNLKLTRLKPRLFTNDEMLSELSCDSSKQITPREKPIHIVIEDDIDSEDLQVDDETMHEPSAKPQSNNSASNPSSSNDPQSQSSDSPTLQLQTNSNNNYKEASSKPSDNGRIVHATFVPSAARQARDKCGMENELYSSPHPANDANDTSSLPNLYVEDPQYAGQVLIQTENLRQWIAKLESEVKSFNEKTSELDELKKKYSRAVVKLECDSSSLKKSYDKDKTTFEEYKNNELRKIKRERKILDDYQKALRTMPNKKERDEIEKLKTEKEQLAMEFESKEQRMMHQLNQIRNRNLELEKEKGELKLRISRMEHECLDLQTKYQLLKREQKPAQNVDKENIMSTINNVNKMLSEQLQKQTKMSNDVELQTDHSLRSRVQVVRHSQHSTSGQDERAAGSAASIQRRTSSAVTRPVSSAPFVPPTTAPKPTTNMLSYSGDQRVVGEENGIASRQCTTYPRNASVLKTNGESPQTKLSYHVDDLPMPNSIPRSRLVQEMIHPDGSVEYHYSNGLIVIEFTNGSVKEIFPGGETSVVSLFNGDIKRTLPDGRIMYTYSQDGSIHITHQDQTEEIVHKDGRREIIYENSMPSRSTSIPASAEETTADSKSASTVNEGGVVVIQLPNGDRELRFPNGQIEIHSSTFKRRIYPDGNMKTVYTDGRQETRYVSGRVRVKDSKGNLILDNMEPKTVIQDHII